jgi:hypothetical protein
MRGGWAWCCPPGALTGDRDVAKHGVVRRRSVGRGGRRSLGGRALGFGARFAMHLISRAAYSNLGTLFYPQPTYDQGTPDAARLQRPGWLQTAIC